MLFLIYGRAAGGVGDDTAQLDEAHWSYMDRFAGRMIARGPTLSADRRSWTGSLHVVDLPDAGAARAFAQEDPYHLAGRFSGHLVRSFEDLLGRTMWHFPGRADAGLSLVLAGSPGSVPGPHDEVPAPPASVAERLVLWGRLRTEASPQPSGMAMILAAADTDSVHSVIAGEPALLGGHVGTEVHAWEFGGRR